MRQHADAIRNLITTTVGSRAGATLCLCLALVAPAGCGRGSNAGGPAAGAPGGSLPPTEVGVITVAFEAAATTAELPGRVSAVRVAEVRARATGILLRRLFDEGADVKADQVLFEIDPAPLQASYDSAKASLAKAQATLEQARAKAKRNETLLKINGVSQQAYEDAKASALQSDADVQVATAALETARLNLGYAKVTAPISGRIGKALITEGALASASEATKMAVIQQLDPVYVDFTQSSADLLKLRRTRPSGREPDHSGKDVRITLVLEDGATYGETGRLVFADASVDESTGSVTVRGEFRNSESLLLPGMFVRGRIELTEKSQALAVPQRGVSRDTTGQASVLIVNAQNQVEQRAIQTGAASGDRWIVISGLTGGERVIVEGLQKVRVGSTVNPVPFKQRSGDSQPASAPSVRE